MATKVKILYILTKDDVGGAQKYVYDLVNNLDKEKFEVKVLTGGKNGLKFLSNSLLPYFLFINDWLALFELFFALRREKPDILHLNNSKAGIIGAFAAFLYNLSNKLINSSTHQLKTVFTAHGWVFNPNNQLGYGSRKFYALLHKLAGLFQDKIINVSEYDKKLALQHKIAAPEKLIAIRNGIDHKNLKFLDKKTARKTLSKLISNFPAGGEDRHGRQFPISNNEVWVGSVGRLVREKNYPDLVAAASLLKNKNLKFFVIGSGYEKLKLRKLISKNGLENNFFILENLAPADIYLKAFDIFVLPSVKEGLPYTILEAMAAGLPIVATRVGGIPEILENRGLVMPPKEPTELARAINFLLTNSENSTLFANEANKYARSDLTINKMVKKTEAVYLS